MVQATLYPVEGRSRDVDLGFAQPSHFQLGTSQTVDAEAIFTEAVWTPYCIDHEARLMYFVELPPDVDLAQAVFVYDAQYHHAIRVLAVPYDALKMLAEQVTPPENYVFILNLPRSGTTLTSNMFNEIETFWSLSEPDLYTNLAHCRQAGMPEDEFSYLLHYGTHLMFRPPSDRKISTLVIKPRSQALFLADTLYETFPDARYLFVYRDGGKFAESMYRFIQRLGLGTSLQGEEMIVNAWRMFVTQKDASKLRKLVDISSGTILFEEFGAAAYIVQLEEYLRTLEMGMQYCAVHYDDLNENREATLKKIIRHCGLSAQDIPLMIRAFEKDSQSGTSIARHIDVEPFSTERRQRFDEILRRDNRFYGANYRLPDIYSKAGM